MATPMIDREGLPPDLLQFLDSLPSPDAIRERLESNDKEKKLLKRLLTLINAAEPVKSGKPNGGEA